MRKMYVFCLLILCLFPLSAQRVYVDNGTLKVNGHPFVINGANTPWIQWNDFGGIYKPASWDYELGRLAAAGGNAVRIWITCNPDGAVKADASGFVSPPAQKFWDDLDNLFVLAEKYEIYVLATLISFDHTKNTYNNYQNWRQMYQSSATVDSFVNNYVVPFVNRYKSSPYLFAVEPCNEIEWVNQSDDNAGFPWSTLQYFVARVVAAVHENSGEVLTTIGLSMKWQTDSYPGNEGNQFSDARLQAAYNDSDAYLDFYSPHFYDWVVTWYGNPFAVSGNLVADYGLTDKPVIIGELPANGVGGVGITDCFENAYANGFQGLMPWTSNGVDSNGSLDSGLGAALTSFKNNHPDLVDPPLTGPLKGDVNGDDMVNIVDALMTAQYTVGLEPQGFNPQVADASCDGFITIVDALVIAQYSVGLISQFPCQ